MASPDEHVRTSLEVVAPSKRGEQISGVNSKEKEAGGSPIKVTSMVKELEKSESPMRLSARMTSYDIKDETIPKSSDASKVKDEGNLVVEQITRTQSTSLQEKELLMEEMFKRLENESQSKVSSMKLEESNNNFDIHQQSSHKTPTYSVGDDEVFSSSNDDSLPPPPPPLDLETSHDNLPLPTPPRELLVEESPLRAEIVSKDRERNIIEVKAVEHTINRLETPRWSDIPSEKKKLSYSEEKTDEEKSDTEKAVAKSSPQGKENLEEKEPKKYGIEQTFKENESVEVFKEKNTRNYEMRHENEREIPGDIDFIKSEIKPHDSNLYENEYVSPEKSMEISLETSRSEYGSTTKSPPPPPLVITSTPTTPQEADDGSSPDNDMAGNTSPFSGSSLSTPSSSRPGSMVSPKLEALDKEKVEYIF